MDGLWSIRNRAWNTFVFTDVFKVADYCPHIISQATHLKNVPSGWLLFDLTL
jgi:hypothetical protein